MHVWSLSVAVTGTNFCCVFRLSHCSLKHNIAELLLRARLICIHCIVHVLYLQCTMYTHSYHMEGGDFFSSVSLEVYECTPNQYISTPILNHCYPPSLKWMQCRLNVMRMSCQPLTFHCHHLKRGCHVITTVTQMHSHVIGFEKSDSPKVTRVELHVSF